MYCIYGESRSSLLIESTDSNDTWWPPGIYIIVLEQYTQPFIYTEMKNIVLHMYMCYTVYNTLMCTSYVHIHILCAHISTYSLYHLKFSGVYTVILLQRNDVYCTVLLIINLNRKLLLEV